MGSSNRAVQSRANSASVINATSQSVAPARDRDIMGDNVSTPSEQNIADPTIDPTLPVQAPHPLPNVDVYASNTGSVLDQRVYLQSLFD